MAPKAVSTRKRFYRGNPLRAPALMASDAYNTAP